MEKAEIFKLIVEERRRQDIKFPFDWRKILSDAQHYKMYGILGEEFGELGKAINEHDHSNLVKELIQVAATAVKWLERMYPDADSRRTVEEWSSPVRESQSNIYTTNGS